MIISHVFWVTTVVCALVKDLHSHLWHHPNQLLHGGVAIWVAVVHRRVPFLVTGGEENMLEFFLTTASS